MPNEFTVAPLDLGDLQGPVLLFGGPYSNLQSTEAVWAEADRLTIPPSNVICTGDIVAYCAQPAATVDLIRDWGCQVVLGNCEEALGEGGDDCKCGFEKGSVCDLLSLRWFAHAQSQITEDQRAWMRGLPHPVTFSMAGFQLAAVHGHERDISEWIFGSSPDAEKQAALDSLNVDGIIAGHSGLPFTQVLGKGGLWHNPGVIGIPANDGTQQVWYSIFEPQADGIRVSHRALTYDHALAAQQMRDAGMPDAYAVTLETGIWPNQDILPTMEQGAKGKALSFEDITWTRPCQAVA